MRAVRQLSAQHGGPRWSCRSLRERRVRAHARRIQQLSQPALRQVPGIGSTRVAGSTGGRAAARAVLPRRVLVARRDWRHRLPEQGRRVRPADEGFGRRDPLPVDFRTTTGSRTIRVALAFDPPVRHTRLEHLGTRMSFYLMRGMTPAEILEFFRRREDKTKPPPIASSAKCDLYPGIEARETSTLQCASFSQARNSDRYGDTFYLTVLSHRRWAGDDIVRQRFAVAVELAHEGCQELHQNCSALNLELRARLRLDA
jgi:hypothetical protein